MTLVENTLVKNNVSHGAFGTAKYNPLSGKPVETDAHFERRINLPSTGDFTRSKFTNLNYFGQQCEFSIYQKEDHHANNIS